VTTARLVLFLEGNHDDALREALTRGRTAMEATAIPALAQLGARDPVTAGAAIAAAPKDCSCTRSPHDDTDPRRTFDLVVRAALA
jgi:hypothetical protein